MHSPDAVVELLGPNAAELVKLLPEFAGYLSEHAPFSISIQNKRNADSSKLCYTSLHIYQHFNLSS